MDISFPEFFVYFPIWGTSEFSHFCTILEMGQQVIEKGIHFVNFSIIGVGTHGGRGDRSIDPRALVGHWFEAALRWVDPV